MLAEVFWGQPLRLTDRHGRTPREIWQTQTPEVARALMILGSSGVHVLRKIEGRSDGRPMRQFRRFRVRIKVSPLTPLPPDIRERRERAGLSLTRDFVLCDPARVVEVAEDALRRALEMGVVSEVTTEPDPDLIGRPPEL